MVTGEELVREPARTTVAELELSVGRGEVWEAWRWLVQAAGTQVHGEAAHLAGAAEEWSAAHRRQLLQPPLLTTLVLEPHLKQDGTVRNHETRNTSKWCIMKIL